jgi:hypothetical protein
MSQGQLAINLVDKKLYTKDNTNTIAQIGVARSEMSAVAFSGAYGDLLGAPSAYVLPVATSSILGGVKAGTGVTIAGDGTISVSGGGYTLPTASASVLGGIKIGTGLSIDGSGVVSVSGSSYTLPAATTSVLGGVIVKTGLTVDASGNLSANVTSVAGRTGIVTLSASDVSGLATVATTGAYADLSGKPTIPAAQVNSDWNAVSGVAQILNKPTIPAAQVSSDWNASSGVAQILNKPTTFTPPIATASVLGGVKIGSGVTVAGDGTISVTAYSLPTASASVLGGVKVGTGLAVAGDGTLSVSNIDLGSFFPGIPANSQRMARTKIIRTIILKAGLPSSQADADAAATAATTLTIKQNGTSIGTVNFAAGASIATFTFSADITLAAGDVLAIDNQASADATLGNISITLAGLRG